MKSRAFGRLSYKSGQVTYTSSLCDDTAKLHTGYATSGSPARETDISTKYIPFLMPPTTKPRRLSSDRLYIFVPDNRPLVLSSVEITFCERDHPGIVIRAR